MRENTHAQLEAELRNTQINLKALAQHLGYTLPAPMGLVAEPVEPIATDPQPLPTTLQESLRDSRPLERAIEQGLITPTPTHWESHLASKTLLVYFLGRLFCGDTPRLWHSTMVWHQPKRATFPNKPLTDLFGLSNLRSLRKKNKLLPLPKGHKVIDNLFDN